MKNIYFTLPIVLVVLGAMGYAQDQRTFDEDFEPIKNELTNWDQVRGSWLAESMVAISNQSEVPDRTFPENLTPAQMLDAVPAETSNRLRAMVAERNQTQTSDPRWSAMNNFVSRPSCKPTSGRSYGDPHLESFDGARYSFQTVGEFDLVRSNDDLVRVQARQKAQQENFSLNTAIAMNVGGDRVGIYAEDVPDGDHSTPIRVNGMPVTVTDRPYFLSRGGTIRRSRGMYVVDWPTGESVTAQVRNSGGMSFLNVTTNIYPCLHGGYTGLMGNANNISSDDYNTSRDIVPIRTTNSGPNATYVKRQHLAFLAKEFADEHRISMATSLFDYPIGTSTFTFTDRSFPRVHMTVDDLSPDRRERARRHCSQNGISDAEMEGCIFDNAFLNLPPTPRHVVDDPTEGIVLNPIQRPVVNTNDRPFVGDKPKPRTVFDTDVTPKVKESGVTQPGTAQPMDKQDGTVSKEIKTEEPKGSVIDSPKPKPSTPKPIYTPKPTPAPKPVPTPKPKPVPIPKPKPTPVPAPKPSTPVNIGSPIKGGR